MFPPLFSLGLAKIQQLALIASTSSLHSGACNALGAALKTYKRVKTITKTQKDKQCKYKTPTNHINNTMTNK